MSDLQHNIESVLVVSTSHLSPDRIRKLRGGVGHFGFSPLNEGWLVWVCSDKTEYPVEMQPIIEKAYDLGCEFVRFSHEAEPVDCFEVLS